MKMMNIDGNEIKDYVENMTITLASRSYGGNSIHLECSPSKKIYKIFKNGQMVEEFRGRKYSEIAAAYNAA